MKTAKLLLPLLGLALLAGCNKTEEPAKPAASAPAAVSYIDKIKARDKLIVGVFTDKPPFGFVDEAGRYVGFDTDIGRQFAKDLLGDENKVEFVAVEPASRIPFLQSDKVDLILANMTVTPERKEAVEFTNPNLKVAVQALVPNDSTVKSLDDLATRTTIVTTGTTADIWLTKNHPDWKLLKFEKTPSRCKRCRPGVAMPMPRTTWCCSAGPSRTRATACLKKNWAMKRRLRRR